MQFSLKLPTVDSICQVLNSLGKNVKIFKVDLARAFRQLHLDPFDVKYLGLKWKGAFYIDISVPFGWRNGTLACERVTDAIRYILATKGLFVLNYIDDIVGIAPSNIADKHFNTTIGILNQLGLHINHSKTLPPTSVATCLGIVFNIQVGVLQIPWTKLQEIISLCHHHIGNKSISKQKLQALIGSLIFLHKAIKPARVFVNRILALLRSMGDMTRVTIDEGTKQDLRWFISCAHAVNGTVQIYKCLRPRLDIYVDASLKGVGGVLQNYVYKLALPDKPGWCIAYWETINVMVAIRNFAKLIAGSEINIWCDNQAAVSILNSGRAKDPILQAIARNLWLESARLDCNLYFTHIKGADNRTAYFLSRWQDHPYPTPCLFQLLNAVLIWTGSSDDIWNLNFNI
jgi:hypothetical protein